MGIWRIFHRFFQKIILRQNNIILKRIVTFSLRFRGVSEKFLIFTFCSLPWVFFSQLKGNFWWMLRRFWAWTSIIFSTFSFFSLQKRPWNEYWKHWKPMKWQHQTYFCRKKLRMCQDKKFFKFIKLGKLCCFFFNVFHSSMNFFQLSASIINE